MQVYQSVLAYFLVDIEQVFAYGDCDIVKKENTIAFHYSLQFDSFDILEDEEVPILLLP